MNYLKVLVLTLFCYSLISCSKTEDGNKSNPKLKTIPSDIVKYFDIMDDIGSLHNEFLDSLYFITPKEDFKEDLTQAKFDEFIAYGKGFFDRRHLDYEADLDLLDRYESVLINQTYNYQNDSLIPALYKAFLTDLVNAISILPDTTSNINNLVDTYFINKVTTNNYSDSQILILAKICGVAKYSYIYWHNNGMNWKKPVKSWFNPKYVELMINDASGAAMGTMLPGVGTAFGCAFFSAATAFAWD